MWRQTKTIAWFTALEARRGRLLRLMAATLLAAFLLSEIAAAAAVTESNAIRLAFLAATLRVAAVFLIASFIAGSITREQADKGSEMVLSLPLPRYVYYLGKLAGFAVIAVVIVALYAALVALHSPFTQTLLWACSLLCELLVIVALTLLCSFTFAQVPVILSAVAAFYLLSRTMEAIRLMSRGPLVDTTEPSSRLIAGIVDGIAYVLPNLDRFTPTEWLIYHSGGIGELAGIAAQSAIYLALLIAAGLFDLYRRNF
ncbi:MAG: hypothetical protein NFCOHLIN_02833 [Gammaproteobacteria bacterium]|nr:hypothetical protein [Gammaproteobacteria bacterium]